MYNLTMYYCYQRVVYKRCLQYLIYFGADLAKRSVERETVRDIAVRMRKLSLLKVIETACKAQ